MAWFCLLGRGSAIAIKQLLPNRNVLFHLYDFCRDSTCWSA